MVGIRARSHWLARLVWFVMATLMLLAGAHPMLASQGAAPVQPDLPARGNAARDHAALAQAILCETAAALGWPTALAPRPDLPGQAWQAVTPATGPALMSLSVSVAANTAEQTSLQSLVESGLPSGLFHGREAIILHPGDHLASGASCRRGLIAWRCGPYALTVVDETGAGSETRLAEMLFRSAEHHALCGLPASLVILARTADMPQGDSLCPQAMATLAQRYYDVNARGRVELDLLFLDEDGREAVTEWITLGPSLSPFEGHPYEFAETALRQALAHRVVTPIAYVERALVVCPEEAMVPLAGSTAARVIREPNGAPLRIALPAAGAYLELNEIVLLKDGDDLGSWVHELGHTLYSRDRSPSGHHRLTDRYCVAEGEQGPCYGEMGCWDVMAEGNYSGRRSARTPVSMSSYTQVSANWLRYASAPLDVDLPLTALEHQRIGDAVLTLDNPLSDDPRSYYILEARDRDTAYGAPQSGVAIYLVTYDDQKCHAVVNKLTADASASAADGGADAFARPTLYGVGQPDGVTQIDLAGGLRVTLVAEQFQPYRATVRIEHR